MKKHLNRMLEFLTRKFGPNENIWFLEFQQRGAPHIHIMSTISLINEVRRLMVAKKWASIQGLENWPYCRIEDKKLFHVKQSVIDVNSHPDAWELIRDRDGAKKYCLKYALKTYQKEVPEWFNDVGRFWGKSRGVLPGIAVESDISEDDLRDFFKRHKLSLYDGAIVPKFIIMFNE